MKFLCVTEFCPGAPDYRRLHTHFAYVLHDTTEKFQFNDAVLICQEEYGATLPTTPTVEELKDLYIVGIRYTGKDGSAQKICPPP